MTITQKYLISVLCDALHSIKSSTIAEININELEQLCIENSIVPIIYREIKESPFINQPKWKHMAVTTNIRTVQLLNGAEEFITLLEKHDIPVIWMKGAYLRFLYPNPQDRSMCDVDLLIKESDFSKAREIIIANNYSIEQQYKQGGAVYSVTNQKGVNIELHTCIIQPNEFIYAKTFIDPWANCSKRNELTEVGYYLSDEDNFIHMIAHLAKHLEHHGAGIRYLMDVSVFIMKKKEQVNWDNIFIRIKDLGLLPFTNIIMKTCEIHFDVKLPEQWPECNVDTETTNELIEHMLICGTFGRGSKKNQVTSSIHRSGEGSTFIKRVKFLIWLAFPNSKALKKRYKYLQKYPWLLPVCWIHRAIEALFIKDSHARNTFIHVLDAQKHFEREETLHKKLELSSLFPE